MPPLSPINLQLSNIIVVTAFASHARGGRDIAEVAENAVAVVDVVAAWWAVEDHPVVAFGAEDVEGFGGLGDGSVCWKVGSLADSYVDLEVCFDCGGQGHCEQG